MTDLVGALNAAFLNSLASLSDAERASFVIPPVEARGRAAVLPSFVTSGPGGAIAWPAVAVWASLSGVYYVLKWYPDRPVGEGQPAYVNYGRPRRFRDLGDALRVAVEV